MLQPGTPDCPDWRLQPASSCAGAGWPATHACRSRVSPPCTPCRRRLCPCSGLACPRCVVKAEGVLARELAQSRTLQSVNLQQNAIGGGLPPEYGGLGAFPRLLHLVVSSNSLNGAASGSTQLPRASCTSPPLQPGIALQLAAFEGARAA